ncbi:ParB/RepB/Spo0J family partition protein [Shigella boydii]|nr:ParB/RepB/Spo0J family partition protein [Shigella boydii]
MDTGKTLTRWPVFVDHFSWTNERIGTELGMDQDEVLRLKQISGLTELFQEEDFSPAWTVR